MRFLKQLFVAGCLSITMPHAVWAAPKPVTLDPVVHQDAELEIHLKDGSVARYTPAELETLPTYQMTTTTPWRAEPATFEGVLLSDLLERHGLLGVDEITITAENDFSSQMERDVWLSAPILVATRVNGQPHSRRARGPIQFVVSAEDLQSLSLFEESHLVWMAARIEAAQ